MIIEKLSAEGVKIASFNHNLTPINIFVGDNTAGKTARLDAVRLLLLGCHPDCPKTNAGTMKLACDNKMRVIGLLNDKSELCRTWTRKSKGVSVITSPEHFPSTPAVMMDARTYLNLSAKERVRYICNLLSTEESDWNGEKICSEINNIILPKNDRTQVEALLDTYQWVVSSNAEREKANEGIQEWVEAMIIGCKDQAKVTRAEVERMKKWQTGQIQLQSSDAEKTRNVDAEIIKNQERIDAVRGSIQTEEDKARQWIERETVRTDIEYKLVKLPDVSEKITSLEKSIKESEATVDDKEYSKLCDEKATLKADIEGIKKCITDGEAALQTISDKQAELKSIEDPDQRITDLRQKQQMVSLTIVRLKNADSSSAEKSLLKAQYGTNEVVASISRMNERVANNKEEISELEEKDCPCCKSVGRNCPAILKTISTCEEDLKYQLKFIEGRKKDLEERNAICSELATELAKAKTDEKEYTEALQSRNVLNDQINELVSIQIRRDTLKAFIDDMSVPDIPDANVLDEKRDTLEKLVGRIDGMETIRSNIRRMREELDGFRSSIEERQKLETQLEALPSMDFDPTIIDELKVDLKKLTAAHEDLIVRQKRHAASQQEEARKLKALEDLSRAEARLEVTKIVTTRFQEIQSAIVEELFGGLISTVNQLCGGVLNSHVVYEDGEIGRKEHGRFISHETFSGAEKLLTYAGISAALSQRSPLRIILLDELGVLQRSRRGPMIDTLGKMISNGLIDQVFATDTDNLWIEEVTTASKITSFFNV